MVREDAREVALERVVLPVLAPAAHDIEAFVELREEQGNVGGIVLQVAVHRDDHVAFREVETGHHRGGLAEVAAEMHDLHPFVIVRGDFVEQVFGVVGGAVVDEDEFPRLPDSLRARCGCARGVRESRRLRCRSGR